MRGDGGAKSALELMDNPILIFINSTNWHYRNWHLEWYFRCDAAYSHEVAFWLKGSRVSDSFCRYRCNRIRGLF
jgi:hypothetical protein